MTTPYTLATRRAQGIAGALLAAAALATAVPATAETFPSKPISLIVSFPPGGITDAVARVLATEMGASLGQSVVVQNVAGAGGTIGTAAIAKAPKSGYSVGFIAAASLTTLPQLQPVSYTLDSFEYVCRAFEVPVFVLVTPDSPMKTLQDLVTFARANPGKLNFATVGPGSLPHLAAVDFAREAGLSLNHVPYKGEGPAVADLLGKHVDLYFGTSAVASRHNLRRLAVAASARLDESPDTPTLTELGYKVSWAIMGGMVAPKGMEPAALETMRQACADAVEKPAFKSALSGLKVRPAYSTGEAFARALAAEAVKNTELLRNAGLLASK